MLNCAKFKWIEHEKLSCDRMFLNAVVSVHLSKQQKITVFIHIELYFYIVFILILVNFSIT